MKTRPDSSRLATRGFAPVLIILAVVLLGGATYTVVQREVLKSFFEKGDKPTQGQFGDVIDSSLNIQDDRKLLGLKEYDTTKEYQAGDTVVKSDTVNQPEASKNLPQGSAWLSVLPLGDGKYVTSAPKKGYIYVCHVATGGGGAQGNPTWIHGATWNPSQKISVSGSVAWPQASFSMKVSGSSRIFTGNGLPTAHNTGVFPISPSDPAHAFDTNPNSIKAQTLSYSLPAYPGARSAPDCIFGQVGIMLDGVPVFDGFDAEHRDALAHETQDAWEAHPERTGQYHYHGFAKSFVTESVAKVVGFAFDGFPITGSKLPSGAYLHTADLDECHGLTSMVTLDGKQVSTYHYVLTQDFPYSVSCFKGASHEPKPGGGTQGQGAGMNQSSSQNAQPNGTPPQEAIDACKGKSSNASCSFSTPRGTLSGVCRTPPNASLACVPQ